MNDWVSWLTIMSDAIWLRLNCTDKCTIKNKLSKTKRSLPSHIKIFSHVYKYTQTSMLNNLKIDLKKKMYHRLYRKWPYGVILLYNLWICVWIQYCFYLTLILLFNPVTVLQSGFDVYGYFFPQKGMSLYSKLIRQNIKTQVYYVHCLASLLNQGCFEYPYHQYVTQ